MNRACSCHTRGVPLTVHILQEVCTFAFLSAFGWVSASAALHKEQGEASGQANPRHPEPCTRTGFCLQ